MDASLLFRKKAALVEDGLDWLKGSDEFPFAAKRNLTGRAAVSAILVRALLAALDGQILEALGRGGDVAARVASKSAPGASAWCWRDGDAWRIPHGAPDKVTYHLGALIIVEALAEPARAADFWPAYAALREAYATHGRQPAIKEALVRAADELYYLARYGGSAPDSASDRFPAIEILDGRAGSPARGSPPISGVPVDLSPLTDAAALRRLAGQAAPAGPAPEPPVVDAGRFAGWQARALADAFRDGLNVLLAGPTGTGKTFALQQAVLESGAALVTVEGKEGLTDLDFLGAILPQPSGERRWVDGPVLRAMRRALYEPVVLFFDEVNRLRREYANLLLGLLNAKPGALCRREGLPADGDGPYYAVEVPMTSEAVWCPAAHLRVAGAGNFGTAYAVYALDPAVRRRFDLVLEFDYLPLETEQALVQARAGVDAPLARALCLVAQYTRQMHRHGDLPGAVDTASLLRWADLCRRREAGTVATVMGLGRLVWADVACGRDHLGLVRQAKFDGLVDYAAAQSVLPKGDLDDGPAWQGGAP